MNQTMDDKFLNNRLIKVKLLVKIPTPLVCTTKSRIKCNEFIRNAACRTTQTRIIEVLMSPSFWCQDGF